MASEENRRITDVGTLKALAHPLRANLYRLLCVERVATASQLAEHVDEAVSLVSYHLRKLAEHGLIEEARPQTADGRERWWQPASDGVSIRGEDFRGEPAKAAAHLAATRLFHDQRADRYHRYLDERPTWPAEWNTASVDNESWMRLTPAELTALKRELEALLRKYDEQGRAAEEAGGTEEREHVALYVYGFPFRV
ncbi:ArsR/SmtB family transcription factor [Streptomyces olivochromogenes]|uniref:ArsR/SmtB family transcription factor n=1 Tax=Streptomyces olivochromogenes TaxID=1963 RepID=UPI001F364903|nr:helix-turn-helix domain-containing protein [Streptomyces olivochromogenes]MCF3133395.1 helix-turn-helix transcriptional regulator [Streptomyces olivochromogenes]